ncbi:MAG: NAD-dependent protein deacylase [Halobacteriovorax sp.]|nr:NAD-dependent protein deacylase [Halobacteriovorax sp.]|tara:strand:- start:4168 stop:4899 length:732 start_codon:yes stop_codon:yes gene_type:complete
MENIKNITILTGAGISAESGISTFRDQNGLWENHEIEDVATPEGFQRNPELVYKFYNQRRFQLSQDNIVPNPAHMALAKLEREFSGSVLVITQNVDDLHERAGQKNLIHMHGELMKMRCVASNKIYKAPNFFDGDTPCPCCQEAGNLRPHIVWFGEMPFQMDKIQSELLNSDLFLSIGTSALVYPASIFYRWAAQGGAKTIELNLESTVASDRFDENFQGKASELVPGFVEDLLSGNISPEVS